MMLNVSRFSKYKNWEGKKKGEKKKKKLSSGKHSKSSDLLV